MAKNGVIWDLLVRGGRTASFRILYIRSSYLLERGSAQLTHQFGRNVGLIGSLAIHARIGRWGKSVL